MNKDYDAPVIALLTEWRGTDTLLRCLQDKLTEREQQVIDLRYGQHGDQPTQADCALVLEITPGRVQKLEETALRKLRHPSVKRYFE